MRFIISDDYPYEERQFYPENFNIDSVKRGMMGFTPRFGSLIIPQTTLPFIIVHVQVATNPTAGGSRTAKEKDLF